MPVEALIQDKQLAETAYYEADNEQGNDTTVFLNAKEDFKRATIRKPLSRVFIEVAEAIYHKAAETLSAVFMRKQALYNRKEMDEEAIAAERLSDSADSCLKPNPGFLFKLEYNGA